MILYAKARLVTKGYAQREGINYNEYFCQAVPLSRSEKLFSPVMEHSSIRILFTLVAQYELDLDHLGMKTAFFHGDQIYIYQLTRFKITGKKNMAIWHTS